MSSLSAQPTGTAVSLEESYKDVTEWYASRTTVNDASSFRVLAVSLLIMVSLSNMVLPAEIRYDRSLPRFTALDRLGILCFHQVQPECE